MGYKGGVDLKKNLLQNAIGFILKYIWLFCAVLILLEIASVTYTAGLLTQQTSHGVMQSVSGEVSGRIDGVLRLLKGMAQDERFTDTAKPLFDRAIQALPYQESYNLYMIALTDEDVNVISADETAPPSEPYSLSYRDYMQRLYATGEYQITDVFVSGDGEDRKNYTIAVPIMDKELVVGSVFGSIDFQDIEDVLSQHSQNNGSTFYLLGSENTIMAGKNRKYNGESFMSLSEGSHFFNANVDDIDASMKAGGAGSYWEWDEDGLTYVTYEQIPATEWTIVYRVQFVYLLIDLIPTFGVKIGFYILMCTAIFVFGRRYLNRHLSQVNHLLNRMSEMQKELFQSEQPDYENILELTQQGLSDQLTGLATRTVLFKKMSEFTDLPESHGAIIFVDLDDLKRINDNFGHEGGDSALLYFAQVLKEYESKYDGIAARYGGDEFILVLRDCDEVKASGIIQQLCIDLHTKIVTKEHTFTIHGSLGVSIYPKHGIKLEELICKADLALYEAKQLGKNQCAFFSEKDTLI